MDIVISIWTYKMFAKNVPSTSRAVPMRAH